VSAPTGLGSQRELLQFCPSLFAPQFGFPAPALVHRQRLQLIHDPRAHLHEPMPMPKQLKIVKSPDPSLPEKAEIEVHGADELYKEIRIDNELEDEHGKKAKLKEDAEVDVVVEAERKATIPNSDKH
jgi:hypothetical protein